MKYTYWSVVSTGRLHCCTCNNHDYSWCDICWNIENVAKVHWQRINAAGLNRDNVGCACHHWLRLFIFYCCCSQVSLGKEIRVFGMLSDAVPLLALVSLPYCISICFCSSYCMHYVFVYAHRMHTHQFVVRSLHAFVCCLLSIITSKSKVSNLLKRQMVNRAEVVACRIY